MTELNLIINISLNKKLFVNPQRIRLLRMIKKTRSLNAASKEMLLSYQNAWTMIDEMNKLSQNTLVKKQRGGSGGGGAEISGYGNLILKEYSLIEQQVIKFTRQLNAEINF